MQLDPRFVKVAHDPGDPVLCSHCPFCGSGQITGRSDGGIDCAFCGQSFIVRVQPAFPGMPQAPGMGAPTDVGPDMPPGMEGMPGMEGEEGMPPGMEGEEGFPPGEEGEEGPPFGEEDDEGGEPGEEAEEEGGPEGEEEGPPFPPKKKTSARTASARYRTLAGDELGEDNYVRHLAVLHAGQRLPAVLAQLRREAYLTTGDDPHHRAKYDEGYSASENFTGYRNPDSSPLEDADMRGEPDSWYQGYMDHATDRPYGHAIECPAHDHDQPGCTLVDHPEKFDPVHVQRQDTAWLAEHRIHGFLRQAST